MKSVARRVECLAMEGAEESIMNFSIVLIMKERSKWTKLGEIRPNIQNGIGSTYTTNPEKSVSKPNLNLKKV